jgi:Fic family protein
MSEKIHTIEINVSMKMMNEISKIERFESSWENIEKREGATLKQLKSIATVRSVGASTRIEGSKMTDDEVEKLIDKIKVAKFEERDEQEVAGYFETLDTICEYFSEIHITEAQIKHLHKMLMKYSKDDEWHSGDYKKISNSVDETYPDGRKRTIFRTTEAGYATQDAMNNLIEWYKNDKQTQPIIKIALFVYDFLSIHPFQDGNGRLSRLIGTLLLLKNGYSWIQYISFEHEIEHRKSEYYKVLMQTQRNRPGENINEWINFFIDCILNIQNQLEEKLKTKQTLENLSNKEQNIITYIENHPGSQSGEISRKLDINLPTVKKILSGLIKKRQISKTGEGRATAYYNEIKKIIKNDIMFTLTNTNRMQHFLLTNLLHTISIKRIILQPKFEWTYPSQWSEKITQQDLGLKISGSSNNGYKFSTSYSLDSMITPYHYQPVIILDNQIEIPISILEKTPLQSNYPIEIAIELTSTETTVDFDVVIVYDAQI